MRHHHYHHHHCQHWNRCSCGYCYACGEYVRPYRPVPYYPYPYYPYPYWSGGGTGVRTTWGSISANPNTQILNCSHDSSTHSH